MAELNYSIDARNVLNRFHGVEKIVYVEGDDDIVFWEVIFEKLSSIKVKIEGSGGKEALKRNIQDIIDGKAEFYVAIDSDFDIFSNHESHKNIFRTFGYSMENTIISDITLQKLISTVARLPKSPELIEACSNWIEKTELSLKPAVQADIVNRLKSLGHHVIPDNCDRFLTSRKSSNFCAKKINHHVNGLNIKIENTEYSSILKTLETNNLLWRDVIRGHFLISAAFRFVKSLIEKYKSSISISRDMFFSSLLLAFEASFQKNHRQYEYYRSLLSN